VGLNVGLDVGRICYRIGVAPSIATSVRRARISDTAAVTDLVNRAFAIEASFIDGQRTNPDEIAALIRSGGFLVLESDHGIGAAVLFVRPGERDGLPSSHAYFGMLSVSPELQGMGLGRRLVRVAEAMAEASGATSMSLRIINLREELSRWYRSLGYREVGTAPCMHIPIKRPCHFIDMEKSLVDAVYAAGAAQATGAAGEAGAA
jgi:ribosomal protein S18 acetylase RimI-like enzyme